MSKEILDKLDMEVMSHIDSEEFILSTEEVLVEAFTMTDSILEGLKGLPVEHVKVVVDNSLRVHDTIAELLSKVDFERTYWKQ